jgi:hypothetical protein
MHLLKHKNPGGNQQKGQYQHNTRLVDDASKTANFRLRYALEVAISSC